jgi:hypothetical protein
MALEERAFTKAEMKLFAAKYEIFQEAQRVVEEFVTFLKEQHECEEPGWQIGQNGFFRSIQEPSETTIDVPPSTSANANANENGEAKPKKQA